MCESIHERLARRLSTVVSPMLAVRDGIPADKIMVDLWGQHEIASRPLPPKELQAHHDPRVMQQHWERLMVVLRNPVDEIEMPGGWKAFRVLGNAVFLRSPKGCFHVYIHEVDHGHVSLAHIPDYKIMATEIPYRFVWLRAICSLAKVHAAAVNSFSTGFRAWEYEPYLDWMYSVFERRIKSHCDMRQVRRRIRKTLQIQEPAWQMAHRLHFTTSVKGKITLRIYNFAVRNFADLEAVQKDAPNALPVYAAWCETWHTLKTKQPVQALKKHIHHLGLGTKGWSLVLRDGHKVMDLVNQFYSGYRKSEVEDCLKIFVGLGVSRLPKPWVSHALFATYGNAHATRESYFNVLPKNLSNLAHAVRHADEQLAIDEQGERDLVAIFDYLTDHNLPVLTRRQRQQGWPYLVRNARAYEERIAKKRMSTAKAWDVPFSELQYRGLRMRAMGNSEALLEEGHRMRNCLGNRIERYAKMDNLAVAVDKPNGKRCATAEYFFADGRWQFRHAQGPMNRELDAGLKSKLGAFAGQIKVPPTFASENLTEIAQNPIAQKVPDCPKVIESLTEADDLGVRFYNCDAGWIRMGISAGASAIEIHMSHLYDPIAALVEWMEVIVLGADECSFVIDEEGTQVIFRAVKLDNNCVHLQVGPEFDTPTINVQISTYRLVSSIYRVFVRFSESDDYKAQEWESQSLADILHKQGECRTDAWLDAMQKQTRREVQKAIWKLDPIVVGGSLSSLSKSAKQPSRFDTVALDHEVLELTGKPAESGQHLQFWSVAEWGSLKSAAARRNYLKNLLADQPVGSWSGGAWPKIRSVPVESWLEIMRRGSPK